MTCSLCGKKLWSEEEYLGGLHRLRCISGHSFYEREQEKIAPMISRRKKHPGVVLDIGGRIFGRLVVLGISKSRCAGNRIMWTCRCQCGTVKAIRSSSLINGHTQSCGCLHQESVVRNGKARSRMRNDYQGT